MISKPAKVIALEEEIVYAKSQLQPHDTGHIHTAISWMEQRVERLKEELRQLYNDPHGSLSTWDGEDQYDGSVDGYE